MKVNLNTHAPIVPWESMGEIQLYTHLKDLSNWLEQERAGSLLIGRSWVRYEIKNVLYLFFDLLNGKLFKLVALSGYKGKLFDKMYIGQPIEDALRLESGFEYDDFEEVYVNWSKGVFVETDPLTNTINSISVFVRELATDAFEHGDW